jgi:hypothetical protein
MGSIISDEEVMAIGRQRQEEARLTRPHMLRLPEAGNALDSWKRIGERLADRAASRWREGRPRQSVH